MPRLPIPGSDDGTWGDLLNDFLTQAHQPDGTLKSNTITSSQVQDGAIEETKLSSSVQTKLNTPTSTPDGSITPQKLATTGAPSTDQVLSFDGTTLSWATPLDDHGQLAGLSNDDHPQYLTNSRGDTRYYQKSEIDTALSGKADDTSVVHATGSETVSGVKTFTNSPVVPDPTQNNQAASRGFVLTTINSLQTYAIVVASVEMPQSIKDSADYVCDGVNDEVEINAAIAQASPIPALGGSGIGQGIVQLTAGLFTLGESVLMRSGVTLRGIGGLTQITGRPASLTGNGTELGLIKLATADVHHTRVEDFWINSSASFTGHLIDYEGDGMLSSSYPFSTGALNRISRLDIGSHNWGAINITNCPNVYISHVNIRYVQYGILAYQSQNLQIDNVNINYTMDNAIDCYDSSVCVSNSRVIRSNWAFNLNGSFASSITNCTASDSAFGFSFGGKVMGSALTASGMSQVGFRISAGSMSLNSCYIYNTGTGLYPTSSQGFSVYAAPTDLHINGVIEPANITTPINGDLSGARNFIRISNGSTLVSYG